MMDNPGFFQELKDIGIIFSQGEVTGSTRLGQIETLDDWKA
jgi:hypothetical protein